MYLFTINQYILVGQVCYRWYKHSRFNSEMFGAGLYYWKFDSTSYWQLSKAEGNIRFFLSENPNENGNANGKGEFGRSTEKYGFYVNRMLACSDDQRSLPDSV